MPRGPRKVTATVTAAPATGTRATASATATANAAAAAKATEAIAKKPAKRIYILKKRLKRPSVVAQVSTQDGGVTKQSRLDPTVTAATVSAVPTDEKARAAKQYELRHQRRLEEENKPITPEALQAMLDRPGQWRSGKFANRLNHSFVVRNGQIICRACGTIVANSSKSISQHIWGVSSPYHKPSFRSKSTAHMRRIVSWRKKAKRNKELDGMIAQEMEKRHMQGRTLPARVNRIRYQAVEMAVKFNLSLSCITRMVPYIREWCDGNLPSLDRKTLSDFVPIVHSIRAVQALRTIQPTIEAAPEVDKAAKAPEESAEKK